MTEHAIKIKEMYFNAVLSGEKTFEIRKNDRDYKVGDIIHFVPVDDECGMIIPHEPNAYKITYVFHGGEYGLEEGYCVFGITSEAHDREIREKIVDEFVSRLEKHEQENWTDHQEYGITWSDIEMIAEQLKGGGNDAENN